jgi:predicted ATP-grasp superfamily ATP-dependent carboligase
MAAAAECDLAPPEGILCDDAPGAAETAEAFGYPVLLKPVETVLQHDGLSIRRAARLCPDEPALRRALAELGTAIVQRWEPGPVVSVGGVATPDGVIASVTSRYVRTWPARAGNVAFSETIEAPPALLDRVGELVERLEWQGLFELEVIDCGEGRYAAIDFNPRAYGSLALARSAGVPLSVLWCRWLAGEGAAKRLAARPGLRYRWEDADLRHAAWQLRHGQLGAALASLAPRRRVTHAYFRLRDPLPLLVRLGQLGVLLRERPGVSLGSETPRRSSAR